MSRAGMPRFRMQATGRGALCRWEEMRQLDQEDRERMARIKQLREQEERAQQDAEAELV